MADEKLTHWVGVVAKSLAYLALQIDKDSKKTMGDKALFLEAVGLSSDEQAGLLGSTPNSLKQQKYLLRKERREGDKGGNGGATKKRAKGRGNKHGRDQRAAK